MPIYEYSCRGCGNKFEELITNSDSSVTCPECGSSEVEKEFSVFAASSGSISSALPCGAPSCGSGFS